MPFAANKMLAADINPLLNDLKSFERVPGREKTSDPLGSMIFMRPFAFVFTDSEWVTRPSLRIAVLAHRSQMRAGQPILRLDRRESR